MKHKKFYIKLFLLIISISIIAGCKGSETGKAIDSTIDEFTGYRAVKQSEEMKKDIGELNKQQEERAKQLETE